MFEKNLGSAVFMYFCSERMYLLRISSVHVRHFKRNANSLQMCVINCVIRVSLVICKILLRLMFAKHHCVLCQDCCWLMCRLHCLRNRSYVDQG